MEVEFELREEDYVAFAHDYGGRRQTLGMQSESQQRRSVVALASLAILALVLPNLLPREQEWIYPTAAMSGAFAALALVVYKSMKACSANALEADIRRLLTTPDGKYLVERRTAEINPREFRERSATYEQALSWERIPAVSRTDDRLFIYRELTAQFAAVTIVPRRAFRSDADFDEFCGLAEGYWQASQPKTT